MRYSTKCYMCFILFQIVFISNGDFKARSRPCLRKNSTLKGKIIGGTPVPIDQYPSAAQFFNLGNFCAGTILNSRTVLTAAHCFDFNKNVQDMMVHVGTRHMYDHRAQVHEVHSFIIHEDYNKAMKFACDIALLFLESPIKYNNKIKNGIIADTTKWMSATEKNFEVTGWGWTKYGGPLSKHGLMVAVLRYVPLRKCRRIHNLDLTPEMFCLYGDGIHDSCRGDSGGGVLWNKMVVGIISHGDGCAKKGKPGVYINVLYFRVWMESKIKSFSSNNKRI